MKYHSPVMLNELLQNLNVQQGQKYIDATLGDAGHTIAILEKGALVLGIEIYDKALERANERITNLGLGKNFSAVNDNFVNITKIAHENGFDEVNGIIFDLGYSSFEYDVSDLGISFKNNIPLDMRVDKKYSVTAADMLNSLPEKQLEAIIREYGGEKNAKRYASLIIDFRNKKKFYFTSDLSDLIKNNSPFYYEKSKIHPATRTFQALRIAVNNEIDNLHDALPGAARLLLPGGRMAIISFHSLEEKQAKSLSLLVQPRLNQLVKKPITPSAGEVAQNPRARSAKMRVYERI